MIFGQILEIFADCFRVPAQPLAQRGPETGTGSMAPSVDRNNKVTSGRRPRFFTEVQAYLCKCSISEQRSDTNRIRPTAETSGGHPGMKLADRCRINLERMSQPRPDSGLGLSYFSANVVNTG